jgi:phosphocarrier protein
MTEKAQGSTVEAELPIVNELGLHARAATKFVQTAGKFKSDVAVEKDGQVVNGKSIMGVLMLVASKGTSIIVRATGEDAADCLKALTQLVAERFGEDR